MNARWLFLVGIAAIVVAAQLLVFIAVRRPSWVIMGPSSSWTERVATGEQAAKIVAAARPFNDGPAAYDDAGPLTDKRGRTYQVTKDGDCYKQVDGRTVPLATCPQ